MPRSTRAARSRSGIARARTFAVQPRINLLPVEILDKDKKSVTKLKVGKMSYGVLSETGPSATLNIDNDLDRFYVRIPGAASMGSASVKVETLENPSVDNLGRSYNDDATEIDLHVEGEDLISKSMLLVSDEVDDDHQVDGIADDAKNDRTHKIQLGGTLQIKSIKLNTTEHEVDIIATVPERSAINLGVAILRQTVGGANVIEKPEVEEDLIIARERYAQIGLALKWNISIKDPPPGVDLTDELDQFASNALTPTNEEKSLLSGLATPAPDDIQVFYVNGISSSDESYSYGESFSIGQFTISGDAKYTGNIIIAENRRPFVLGHELGHILLNSGSHEQEDINLMNVNVGECWNLNILESKRLHGYQDFTISNGIFWK